MKQFLILFLLSIMSAGLPALSEETTLYFVRHGQTDWNVQGKLQGHADIPLNEAGRGEAAALQEKIDAVDFDICFSSDLQRAMQTARILACPLIIRSVPALRERDYGPWEGRLFSELLEYEKCGHPLLDIESDEAIQKRIFPLLDEIVSDHRGATILIVTHGSVIRSLLSSLLHIDSSSILNIQMKTMATLRMVASGGQYEIREMDGIYIYAQDRVGN